MKAAAVYTVEQTPDGYDVCRDGVTLLTPAGFEVAVPNKYLAEAIAAEAPHPRSKAADIPLFQLAVLTIDIVAPKPGETIDRLMAYADSELLCHRTDHPPALVEAQNKIWQPVLDWCAKRFRAPLNTDVGIIPIKQPEASLQTLRKSVGSYDMFRLAGLRQAVMTSGSLVLGLALAEEYLTAEQVCRAAELDAEQQMKDWGKDREIQARIDAIEQDLKLCEMWFKYLVTKN